MDQLSNFISEYLKTCETIKKLNSKTIKASLPMFWLMIRDSFATPITLRNWGITITPLSL